jgi:hypothetical protein
MGRGVSGSGGASPAINRPPHAGHATVFPSKVSGTRTFLPQ